MMYADFSVPRGPADIDERHLREWATTGLSRTDAYGHGQHDELLFGRKFDANEPLLAELRSLLWNQ